MIQTLNAASSLSGTVRLPGDKSISHRYAMLAAIAEGTSVIEHFAASRDCHSTLECLQSLGVELQESGATVTIKGRGLAGLEGARPHTGRRKFRYDHPAAFRHSGRASIRILHYRR